MSRESENKSISENIPDQNGGRMNTKEEASETSTILVKRSSFYRSKDSTNIKHKTVKAKIFSTTKKLQKHSIREEIDDENSNKDTNDEEIESYDEYDNSDEVDSDSDETDESIGCKMEHKTKQKQRVRKHYEPITDNNRTYRYEDNPIEYKRARKRIQNRESATRVRTLKKIDTQELKNNIRGLQDEVLTLRSYNASLSSENGLLRQQMLFYEKVLMERSLKENRNTQTFWSFNFDGF